MGKFLLVPLLGWANRLRFPVLFKITAGLFLLTLVLPDPIPLLDEILLGLGAMVLASFKQQRDERDKPTVIVSRVS